MQIGARAVGWAWSRLPTSTERGTITRVIRAATAAVVSKAVAAAVVKEVAAAQAARPPEVPMMAAPVVVSVPVVPASRPHRSPNHLRA